MGSAFDAGRQIAARRVISRKAETHRHDRYARDVIKDVAIDSHPAAQPLAGRIVEGNPRLIDEISGRLARDEQSRVRRNPEHGSGRVRQGRRRSRRSAGRPGFRRRARRAVLSPRVSFRPPRWAAADTSARQRARCARSSGTSTRASGVNAIATKAVMSAMVNASPATNRRADEFGVKKAHGLDCARAAAFPRSSGDLRFFERGKPRMAVTERERDGQKELKLHAPLPHVDKGAFARVFDRKAAVRGEDHR